MGAFDRSYHGILNRYQYIKEQSATGPVADEYYKGLERLENLRKQNAPNLQNEVDKFVSWMRQNQEGILGREPQPTGGELVRTSTAPVNVGTATKTAGAPAAKSAPLSQSAPAKPATGTGTSQSAQPTGEISQQQKDLFKKLHGSSFNPNSSMDKTKMGQLQIAGSEVGYDDVGKLTNAAYAKQYAGTSKGDVYAKKVGTTGTAKAPASTPTQALVNEPAQDLSLTSSQPIKMNLSSPVNLASSSSSPVGGSTTPPTNSPAPAAPVTSTGTNATAPKATTAPLSNKKPLNRADAATAARNRGKTAPGT